MEEIFTNERHVLSKTGERLAYPILSTKNMYSFSPIDQLNRAPLVKGDHVTALPYHSYKVRKNEKGDNLYLTAYTGVIYYPGTNMQRDADIHDWPWPSVKHPKFGQSVYQGTWLVNPARQLPPSPTTLPSLTAAERETLIKLADTKALGNLRKAVANLPMIFAERRETIQMIGGKVASMVKGARLLQTKSIKEYKLSQRRNASASDKRKLIRRISNEHLEFVFGWLPLISEIEGICEFLTNDKLDFIRSRGVQAILTSESYGGYSKHRPPSTTITGPFAYRDWYGITSKGTIRRMKSVRTALRYKLSSRLVGDASALGFDPIGTGFDLVPLSFISGWVSNFDYWIRTLSPEIGLEFQTGSRNVRLQTAYEIKGTARLIPGSVMYVYGKPAECYRDGVLRDDTREVLLEAPMASLEWDVEIGFFEVAAGISLTIQRYLKPLKSLFKEKQFRYRGPRPRWLPTVRYTGRR